jgi:hypothetical protein
LATPSCVPPHNHRDSFPALPDRINRILEATMHELLVYGRRRVVQTTRTPEVQFTAVAEKSRTRFGFKLDRHDDLGGVVFWTIYTRADRPRSLSFSQPDAGSKPLFQLHRQPSIVMLSGRVTGIRAWISRTNSFGSPVMILLASRSNR